VGGVVCPVQREKKIFFRKEGGEKEEGFSSWMLPKVALLAPLLSFDI